MKILKTKDVKTPERGTKNSSGIDFFIPNIMSEIIDNIKFTPIESILEQNKYKKWYIKENSIIIPPFTGVLIPSGIKVILDKPKNGIAKELVMYNKSGISTKHNLVVGANVVDNDYRGEIHIHVINCSKHLVEVMCGQKIIQGIIRDVYCDGIDEISEDEFKKEVTDRGDGGFGSTGK